MKTRDRLTENDVRPSLFPDGQMNWRDKVVLIIEDDHKKADRLATVFQKQGAIIHLAEDGETGLSWLSRHEADLILLDMLLPLEQGIELVQYTRQITDAPLIVISADNQYESLINGLHAGADDFMREPLRHDELLARSWAAVRRASENGFQTLFKTYNDGYLSVDLEASSVEIEDERVRLTATEFYLLAHLLSRAGRVCHIQRILDDVWAGQNRDSPDIVHVFISQLRRKVEPDPKNPVYIISEHGTGYRFKDHRLAAK
jgi:two-component system KDP operon response regulator KdpE